MRKVTYSMSMSLDGYTIDSNGSIDWTTPSAEVFQSSIDEIKQVDVHLLGRRLYEVMLYWEDPEQEPNFDEAEREWAALWNALPKIVFSSTLTSVDGSYQLASGTLKNEIERLRAEPGDGYIAIGGSTLAAQVAALGLIDEYWIRVAPVLIGGGTPFFAHDNKLVDLELVETRTFTSGVVFLRYRVAK